MLDAKELNRFSSLPPVFIDALLKDIEKTIDEYDACKSYIVRELEGYGVDAFKSPDAYTEVEYDILNRNLPKAYEIKLLAVLAQMRNYYCGG